jgi:hypothetical protein
VGLCSPRLLTFDEFSQLGEFLLVLGDARLKLTDAPHRLGVVSTRGGGICGFGFAVAWGCVAAGTSEHLLHGHIERSGESG